MRDAHRGIGCVHVLPALAAGAVGIHAKVFRLDFHLDGVVDFRRDENAGKGCMPALGLVKGRDAPQPVHANLAHQLSIGVVAGHRKRRRLDACFFRRLIFVDLRAETLALRPAQIKAQKHLRPVLRCRAPGAGGTESQNWAEMLLRLYLRWAERQGFSTEINEYQPAEEAGIKSATFTVAGDYAYGQLVSEIGVPRLVRISPFDQAKRRHTS